MPFMHCMTTFPEKEKSNTLTFYKMAKSQDLPNLKAFADDNRT